MLSRKFHALPRSHFKSGSFVFACFAHAPADKAAMDAIATPAPQPRHRTCDEPEANKRKTIEKHAHWPVERGQIMLHEVVPVLMEKFGTTCVTGAEMDSIDMYAEVHLRRQMAGAEARADMNRPACNTS